MMNIFQRIAIIALGIGTSITNGEVGQICQSRYGYGCPAYESCTDGFCKCSYLMIYTTESVPYCTKRRTEAPCTEDSHCMENSKCIKSRCQCKEGYLRFENSCRQGKVQGLLMSCGNVVGRKIEICNITNKSLCQSKICVCSYGLVPNPWGECEPKSSYLARNMLTEYREKPGLYCRSERDCLDGLLCKNFTCSCPSSCEYKSEKDICDCGAVNNGGVIGTGIAFGTLIIYFWYKVINHTIKIHKPLRTFRAIPVNTSEPPSYSLSPIGAETTEYASASSNGLLFNSSPWEQEKIPHLSEYHYKLRPQLQSTFPVNSKHSDDLQPQPQSSYPINPEYRDNLQPQPPDYYDNLQPQPQSLYNINPTVENLTTSELGPPPPYSLVATPTNSPSISSPTSNVSPPDETQPAYNPYRESRV